MKPDTKYKATYRNKRRSRGVCYEFGCTLPAVRPNSMCQKHILKYRERSRKLKYKYTPEQEIRYKTALFCDWCKLPFDGEFPVQDHDRTCCPTEKTCGKCLRGLVHSICNNQGIAWFEWYEKRTGQTLPMLEEYRDKFQ